MFPFGGRLRRCVRFTTRGSTVSNGKSFGTLTSTIPRSPSRITRESSANAWETLAPAECRRDPTPPDLYLFSSLALTWRGVRDRLGCRVPENFLAGPVRLRRHHAGDGMRVTIMYRSVGLLPRAHAFDPIRHVFRGQIVDAQWRQLGFAGQ